MKIKGTQSQKSPYAIIDDWLFDDDILTEIPDKKILNAINICMLLQKFSMCGGVSIYLNEVFNNYSIYSIDREIFLTFLKNIVIKKRIPRRNMCFFRHHKENKDITLIHNLVPYLKRYEVDQFLNILEKEDEEYYDSFLITMGMKKETKKKLTIKEKKEIKTKKKNPNIKQDKITSDELEEFI